ncbi:MAG: HupE/UreJ family protein [Candidatus Phaeomarinobacter sp.]
MTAVIVRFRWILAVTLASLILPVANASAHELRPAYLEIGDVGSARYELVWKVPVRQGRPLAVEPQFPLDCEIGSHQVRDLESAALIVRFSLSCEVELSGRPIRFEGLDGTLTDVLVRASFGSSTQALRATPRSPVVVLARAPQSTGAGWTYFWLGVEHILLGYDHLLFVLALLFLISGIRRLVETITAFTLAHSVTLGATALGWVSLPSAPVEAIIALSIVFLAREGVIRALADDDHAPRLSERKPWLVAMAFGLLHGFGFAGALQEIGLPDGAVLTALFAFNLGVEAGQLLFVLIASLTLALFTKFATRRLVEVPVTYGIGAVASVWLIERLPL